MKFTYVLAVVVLLSGCRLNEKLHTTELCDSYLHTAVSVALRERANYLEGQFLRMKERIGGKEIIGESILVKNAGIKYGEKDGSPIWADYQSTSGSLMAQRHWSGDYVSLPSRAHQRIRIEDLSPSEKEELGLTLTWKVSQKVNNGSFFCRYERSYHGNPLRSAARSYALTIWKRWLGASQEATIIATITDFTVNADLVGHHPPVDRVLMRVMDSRTDDPPVGFFPNLVGTAHSLPSEPESEQ